MIAIHRVSTTAAPSYEDDRVTGDVNEAICLLTPVKDVFSSREEYLEWLGESAIGNQYSSG